MQPEWETTECRSTIAPTPSRCNSAHRVPDDMASEPATPGKFKPFAWMRDVTAAEGLTGDGTAVAFALFTMQRGGKIDAALAQTIGERAHLPLRSAERGIGQLRKAGLIEVVKRYGKKGRAASGYRLVETGVYAPTAKAGARHIGGNGARHIGGTGCPPYWRDVLEEKKSMRPLSGVQRAAVLAAQASDHRHPSPANGADPTSDCSATNGRDRAPAP